MAHPESLQHAFERVAADFPDRGITVYDRRGRHREYRRYPEVVAAARGFAGKWAALGAAPGEPVLVSVPTSWDWFDAWVGALFPHELEWVAEGVTGGGGAVRAGAFSVAGGAAGEEAVLVVEAREVDPERLWALGREIRDSVVRNLSLTLADLVFVSARATAPHHERQGQAPAAPRAVPRRRARPTRAARRPGRRARHRRASQRDTGPGAMTDDRRRRALDILAEISGVDPDALHPGMSLTGDLGIDSPKALQLLVELEDTLDVEISDEDAARNGHGVRHPALSGAQVTDASPRRLAPRPGIGRHRSARGPRT